MVECECTTWAFEDVRAMMLGNGHNPRCELFESGAGAMSLLAELAEGIKWWAEQEDGVPDELWEPYKRAVYITTGKMLDDEGRA